jgi:uncharacterized protein YndB with AHSA1/START domain
MNSFRTVNEPCMKGLKAKATIRIEAPAKAVWEALTTPALIKQYLFGTDAVSDWKPGSPIAFRGEWEGKPYEDKGTILKAEPNKVFEYTYWSSMSGKEDVPANYANVTYNLDGENGRTVLTITQDGIPTEESKKHSEQNWGMVLTTLKEMLEGNPLAF